jgi:hypothetical protein
VVYAHGNDIHACIQEGSHALVGHCNSALPSVDVVAFGEPTRLRDDVIMGGPVKSDDAPSTCSSSAGIGRPTRRPAI